jgi:hypothetical protein
MKVDTYQLGHWPSEREPLHIGAAVAPVEYNLKDQAPGRAWPGQNPGWRAAGTSGPPPGSERCLSVAVFSIE